MSESDTGFDLKQPVSESDANWMIIDGSLALGLRLFCKHCDMREAWYSIELPRCSLEFGLRGFANVI